MELKSDNGETLGFSTAFVVALECWANTPIVAQMIAEAASHENFSNLKKIISEAGLSRKEILLESLCATISLHLQSSDHDADALDTCLATGVMFPLAAQLYGLGVITIAPSN